MSALQLLSTQLSIICPLLQLCTTKLYTVRSCPVLQLCTTKLWKVCTCPVMWCSFFAAPHSKSGVTVDPKLADRNQQDTLPHMRLMEWVWSYFVDSSTDSDIRHDAGHKSSTRAGAVHAQPSKQASGSSHWQGQEDEKSRKQQRTDGQQTAPSSSGSTQTGASRQVISQTGRCFSGIAEALPSAGCSDTIGRPAEFGCSSQSQTLHGMREPSVFLQWGFSAHKS